MIRTNIYITEQEKAALTQVADSIGIGFAELVRRILDSYIENKLGNEKGDEKN